MLRATVADMLRNRQREEQEAQLRLRWKLAGYQGAHPPKERRCTKRLGSRFCWNWREASSDRCWVHPRAVSDSKENHGENPGGGCGKQR